MAKLTLDWEEDYPYIVLGIATTISDYRLCWSLNKTLKTAFNRRDPILVYNKRKDKFHHSFYVYEDENLKIKYRCVGNKKAASRFLPEMPQADYLLVIDQSPALKAAIFLERIKEIQDVLLVFQIKIDELKHKQNLLLIA